VASRAEHRTGDRPVLITGIRGFTGRYLAAELANAGYRVFGTVFDPPRPLREPPPHADETLLPSVEQFDLVEADLLDAEAIAAAIRVIRPRFVIHLAAITHVAYGDVDHMYRVNVVGARNLLAALVASDARPDKVLLASSANVYGNAGIEVIDEATPPQPANDYGVSKLAMEYMARTWLDRLPLLLARPFNYTGAGQSTAFLIPKIVDHFRRRERSIELGNLDVARDFSDVRDVAAIYHRLLESDAVGTVVNICSGAACSLRDVISMLEAFAGYAIRVNVNPAFVRANEIRVLRGSPQRLDALVGAIERRPLSDTLRWMYAA
jgi:GDP-6-deoxy-D-talose 4-dehydrogenase